MCSAKIRTSYPDARKRLYMPMTSFPTASFGMNVGTSRWMRRLPRKPLTPVRLLRCVRLSGFQVVQSEYAFAEEFAESLPSRQGGLRARPRSESAPFESTESARTDPGAG